jgi:hypothetical protein
MSEICDRSPCTRLLKALGVWIFGTPKGFVAQVDEDNLVVINYCPFCGTRLEEMGVTIVHKYLHPKASRGSSLRD